MKKSVQKSRSPAYIKLYERIRENIVSGIYGYGTRLPSKRNAAADAGVSVITAEHAYALLCDEGYAESRERSGYYVIYKTGDFISDNIGSTKNAPTSVAAHAEKYAFPFSVMAKTMRRVILDCGERILERSPAQGIGELRGAVSSYLARTSGIFCDAEQVIVGSGAEYLYGLIAELLGRDRIFAVEEPSYSKIRSVYEANGIECESLTLGNDGILTSELSRSRAGVLHITPYHSFPSGITADASKRREYIAWAEKRGAYIIEDNYDSELTVSKKNDDTLFSLSNGNVIYLNTFSRTISPSLRVGYMVMPKGLLEKFHEKLGFYSCTVPVFEQYVIASLLDGGDFERHINRVRRAKRKAQNG